MTAVAAPRIRGREVEKVRIISSVGRCESEGKFRRRAKHAAQSGHLLVAFRRMIGSGGQGRTAQAKTGSRVLFSLWRRFVEVRQGVLKLEPSRAEPGAQR